MQPLQSSISRTVFILQNWNSVHIKQELSITSALQLQVSTILLSVSMNLTPLVSCLIKAQSYSICLFLVLAYFTYHNALKIHPCITWVRISFLLKKNNIPPYGLSNFVYQFIHQGKLGLLPPFEYCELCCYKHRYINICLNPSFLSGIYIYKSGVAISYGNSASTEELEYWFPQSEPFYIPTNSTQEFQFSHSLDNICCFLGFLCLLICFLK